MNQQHHNAIREPMNTARNAGRRLLELLGETPLDRHAHLHAHTKLSGTGRASSESAKQPRR